LYSFKVLRTLQTFLLNAHPTQAQAVNALRTLFFLAFAGQALLALVIWGVLLLSVTPTPAPSALMAQVLLGLAVLELPTALLVAALLARSGKQPGALAAALVQGTLLATPCWLALFSWLIGAATPYTLILLGLSALYYALGLLFVGRYAQQATYKPAKPAEGA
jgi:hypothetical protein